MKKEVLIHIGNQAVLMPNQFAANAVLDMMRDAKFVEDYRNTPQPFIRVVKDVAPLGMELLTLDVQLATAADMDPAAESGQPKSYDGVGGYS